MPKLRCPQVLGDAVKVWAYVILAMLFIGLLVGAYLIGKRPIPPSTTDTTTITQTLPIQTTIIREKLAAKIDTVWVDRVSHEVARYSEVIDTNRVHINLAIRYDENENTFDISHDIIAFRDSTYIEKLVTTNIPPKRKALGLAAGVSVGFGGKYQLKNAGLDAGIVLGQRHMLTVFGKTDSTYGLRFGVLF